MSDTGSIMSIERDDSLVGVAAFVRRCCVTAKAGVKKNSFRKIECSFDPLPRSTLIKSLTAH